jgi:hypothetical protein
MSRMFSLLDGEAHEHGDLVLTIEFDVGLGGWVWAAPFSSFLGPR